MLRPVGKWGLLGALDLKAQPTRAQRHLWPAQPCTPLCLWPRWLLPPHPAQPWLDTIPTGLSPTAAAPEAAVPLPCEIPLLCPSRINPQGHQGACVRGLVLHRGEEGGCPSHAR